MYKYTQNDPKKKPKKLKEIKPIQNYIQVKKINAQSNISEYETEQSIQKNILNKSQKSKSKTKAKSLQNTHTNQLSSIKTFKAKNDRNNFLVVNKSTSGNGYNSNNLNQPGYYRTSDSGTVSQEISNYSSTNNSSLNNINNMNNLFYNRPQSMSGTFYRKDIRFRERVMEENSKKWVPGPGTYINPFTGTGKSNTIKMNGRYMDIRTCKKYMENPRPKTAFLNGKENDKTLLWKLCFLKQLLPQSGSFPYQAHNPEVS